VALAYADFVRQFLLSQSAMLSVEGDPAADLSVPIFVFFVQWNRSPATSNYRLVRPPSPFTPFIARDAPRPDYSFIDDLREFISLRLDKVDPYKESRDYCLQQERASRLHERLLEMLPMEGHTMLMEYGEALGAAHYLEVAMLAERAFLDGVRLIVRALGAETHVNDKW